MEGAFRLDSSRSPLSEKEKGTQRHPHSPVHRRQKPTDKGEPQGEPQDIPTAAPRGDPGSDPLAGCAGGEPALPGVPLGCPMAPALRMPPSLKVSLAFGRGVHDPTLLSQSIPQCPRVSPGPYLCDLRVGPKALTFSPTYLGVPRLSPAPHLRQRQNPGIPQGGGVPRGVPNPTTPSEGRPRGVSNPAAIAKGGPQPHGPTRSRGKVPPWPRSRTPGPAAHLLDGEGDVLQDADRKSVV